MNVPREETAKRHASSTPSPPLSPGSPAPLASPAAETPREARVTMRSASPSHRSSPRTSPSPMAHIYPYQKTMQNGFMSDPQSSPIIRG